MITQYSRCTSPLRPPCYYPMFHILFSLSIFLWIINPRYQKLLLFSISSPSTLIAPYSLFLLLLNLHSMYSVLVLLNWEPLDYRVSCQISNLALIPLLDSSTKTVLSAKKYTPRDFLLNWFSELIHY